MITNLPELIVDREKPFKNCQLGREEYANSGLCFKNYDKCTPCCLKGNCEKIYR